MFDDILSTEIHTHVLPISKAMHELLTTPSAEKNLNKLIANQCSKQCTYHIESDSVKLYGVDTGALKTAIGLVKNQVVQDTIIVDPSAKYFLSTIEWEQICIEEKTKYSGSIAIETVPRIGSVYIIKHGSKSNCVS